MPKHWQLDPLMASTTGIVPNIRNRFLRADSLGSDDLALDFKHRVVAQLPRDSWTLTEDDIRRALPARAS